MAATTPAAILERIRTVLEAEPLALVANGDPFSDVGMPNALVDSAFRILHGGMVHESTIAPGMTLRIDRITVTVQQALNFDGYQAMQDLQDRLDDIQRAILADGADHSYMATVEKGSRKVTRPKDADVCIASLSFLIDFDFDEQQT
jgi:hypothetical protein